MPKGFLSARPKNSLPLRDRNFLPLLSQPLERRLLLMPPAGDTSASGGRIPAYGDHAAGLVAAAFDEYDHAHYSDRLHFDRLRAYPNAARHPLSAHYHHN